MLKFAVPAVAALGLVAFAARSQATSADMESDVAPMAWHLTYEADLAKLAYGVENSDQLALMMTCERDQAEAAVYGDLTPVGLSPRKASMSSVVIDPLSGGLEDQTRLSVEEPSIRQLALRGKMAVEGDAGEFELTASREERKLIGDFFAYCGTRAP